MMWLLAVDNGIGTIRELDLDSGLLSNPFPVASSARTIAENSSGTLGLGLATANTGALELSPASSPLSLVAVPLSAPVKAVAASGDNFYVLNGNASSASVSVVDPQTSQVQTTLPAPVDAISISVSGDGADIYVLEPSGRVSQIDQSSGRLVGAFPTGPSARTMATSPDGSTAYVLKGGSVENTAVVTLDTESQKRALPAPSNSVGLVVGADGTIMYTLVGTQDTGNVQAFSLGTTR